MKGLRMREGQEIEIEPEHARYIWVRGDTQQASWYEFSRRPPHPPPRFSSRAGGEGLGRGYSNTVQTRLL